MRAIPTVTGTQMALIDAWMMHEIGVSTFQLMEVAGLAVAHIARDRWQPQRIVALAGTGGNGGDAMVAARWLTGWGCACTVMLTQPRSGYSGIAAHQVASLDALGIPVREPGEEIPAADLIIDGLLGFSLRGDPRGEAARLVRKANAHAAPVLAIDLPSGLDADTGAVGDPCIVAEHTVTLALAKTGLLLAPAAVTGGITVADIGVPPQAYARLGVDVPADLFTRSGFVRVR